MRILLTLLTSCSLLATSAAMAHPGGQDKNGGHFNRKTNEYHCHSEPCFSNKGQVERATDEADREGRQYSKLYNRKDWPHWSDHDGDCMNTRHEILAASSKVRPRLSPDGCYVSMGLWDDPYSGKQYQRASDLDIDHVVPLAYAHARGGAAWPTDLKERFANDPENLLAVDDGLNQGKGAKGPTEWMPPNQSYRCNYIAHFKRVMDKYGLVMWSKEQRIFNRQLQACSK